VFFAIFNCGTHFKSELRRHGWKVETDLDNLRTETVARLVSYA